MAFEQPPPFLRLSPELRNRIYDELLLQKQDGLFHPTERLTCPPILNVCRQVREECSGIFYGNTTFQFDNPGVCIRFLLQPSHKHREMIQEIWYDCSETCSNPASWRRAFLDLPGMDADCKLDKLKNRLAEYGVFMQEDVLKAGVRINGRLVWTNDPLREAREAVQSGALVGRVMFV